MLVLESSGTARLMPWDPDPVRHAMGRERATSLVNSAALACKKKEQHQHHEVHGNGKNNPNGSCPDTSRARWSKRENEVEQCEAEKGEKKESLTNIQGKKKRT